MAITHYITLANGEHIRIPQYCEGIKLAKNNPDTEFTYGLTTWWPVTGKEIMRQFIESIHDRINKKGALDKHYLKE